MQRRPCLGDDDAGDGKHGPAGVDELSLAVLLDVAVGAEAEGVEAVAAHRQREKNEQGREREKKENNREIHT